MRPSALETTSERKQSGLEQERMEVVQQQEKLDQQEPEEEEEESEEVIITHNLLKLSLPIHQA